MPDGRTRVSFLIGEHPPHELLYDHSGDESIACSLLLRAEGHELLPGLERAALERAETLLREQQKLVAAALQASRARPR
jgi:hypothetical protein